VQFSLHKKSTTEAIVQIQIEEADYQSEVKSKLKEYSRKAHVKGFRPGHAPSSLINKMYGRSILVDAVNALLTQHLPQYLKEQDITTVATPLPVADKMASIDWEHQRDFEFEYHIGIVPPFSCELSKEIQVTHYQIEAITPEVLNEHIEELYNERGMVEAVAQSEDQDTVYGLWHHQESNLEEQFGISISNLDEAVRPSLLGLRPGDKATIAAKYLLDGHMGAPQIMESMHEAMRSAGGTVTLTVEQIYRTQPKSPDQALSKQFSHGESSKSVQAFRKEMEEKIWDQYQAGAEAWLKRSIQEVLIDRAAIALPEDFLQKWLHNESPHLSQEELEQECKTQLRALRWSLIRDKLAEDYHIQVSMKDIATTIQQRLEAIFELNPEPIPEDVKKKAIQLFVRDEGYIERIGEELRLSQLFKVIRDRITITPQAVSIGEFKRIIQAR